MNIKTMICAAALLSSVLVMASDTPEVSNVVMSQSETSRRVTITYELSNAANGAVVTLDIETNKTGTATNVDSDWVSIGGAAICNAHGDVWKKVSQGSKTIAWRPDHSWEGHKVALANGGARAVVTAWALDNTPDYMVVDITGVPAEDVARYYPSVDFLPGATLGQKGAVTNNVAYKTTKLLMRKIMAAGVEWTMGSSTLETQRTAGEEATHLVTLSNNYYIGVFEITQRQWMLMKESETSVAPFFQVDGAMRPMDSVPYNRIRYGFPNQYPTDGQYAAYSFPSNPGPTSFLGKLRTKTGIDFDLPSEAQWEFAARAGHGSPYYGDGSEIQNQYNDTNLAGIARCNTSSAEDAGSASLAPASGGTAIVGSYRPNDWGLYDMYGNVMEWCHDWYEADISAHGGRVNVDPANPMYNLSGVYNGKTRVLRGGSYGTLSKCCRSAARYYRSSYDEYRYNGFRVVCTAGLR
ncbi:MAG: formylglycine-generating enzyme family protein [Kiritimatiellae bacterium]|nr:formylglycine-generating enzyme family protein [Kiritimatiellia bacterium]